MATALETSRPTLRIPLTPFKNEPLTDFTNAENARKMKAAISKVRAEVGRECDMVIGDKLIKTTDKIKSVNPAKPSEVVGVFQSAGPEHVEPAMQSALAAFETWKRTSVQQRVSLIHAVAAILRERKFEFAAWMVFEVGKNWAEADADIAETIDFAEMYAREALRLAEAKTVVQMPGESDRVA